MNASIRIENSRESARRPRGSHTAHSSEASEKIPHGTPHGSAENCADTTQKRRADTYYNEWIFLCLSLCLCFFLLLVSGDTIKSVCESDSVNALSASLKSLIEKNEAVSVFFGFSEDEADEVISEQPTEDVSIPTFSYCEELDVKEYIDKYNNENYKKSGRMPVDDGVLSSGYSFRKNPFYLLYEGEDEYEFHCGVDIAADIGKEIYSYLDGRVEKCGLSASWGYYVTIDHGDGLKTTYAHASSLLCTEGQKVKKGDVIALVGDTGRTTGAHLHFEIYENGETKNPKDYLPSLTEL